MFPTVSPDIPAAPSVARRVFTVAAADGTLADGDHPVNLVGEDVRYVHSGPFRP